MQIQDLKIGDVLDGLRDRYNLYVPFGKSEIRLVEDIFTGESRWIRTDGTVVLGFPEITKLKLKKEAETIQLAFDGLGLGN